MTYPTALPKVTGWVYELDDEYAYCDITIRGVRYTANIPLTMFGDDAGKLEEGTMISRPHRRDAEWGIMPIRPWSEARWKRINLRAKRRAKEWAALLYDPQDD